MKVRIGFGTGRVAHRIRIGLSHGRSGQGCETRQIKLVHSGNERQDRVIAGEEEERLHDLADAGANRVGRFLSGAGGGRKFLDAHGDAGAAERRSHPVRR